MKTSWLSYMAGAAAGCGLLALALWLWPGATVWRVYACYGFALVASVAAYRGAGFRMASGLWLLLAAATLLFVGATVNINLYTTVLGGSPSHPVLENNDAALAWRKALEWLYDGHTTWFRTAYPTAAMIWLFGRDILVTLMPGLTGALLTIVLTGAIARRLTGRDDMAFGAMLALAMMCYFMVQATVLIKDVPLTLAVALAALGFLRLRDDVPRRALTWAMIVAAAALMWLYRPSSLMFMVLGALVFAVRRRRVDFRFLGVAVVAFAVAASVKLTMTTSFSPTTDLSLNGYIAPQEEQGLAARLLGEYSFLPAAVKVALLPATMFMQFLIPFPWGFTAHNIFGPTMSVAHCQYTWYLAGALLLYYICVLARRSPGAMVRLVIWAVVWYAVTAYLYAGRISRYCLPALPLVMPAVSYTAIIAWRRRSLRVWLGVFVILLAATLTVCHSTHAS